jgi:hypothetical protein
MPDEARQPPHFALCPCTKRLLLYSGSALRGALTFQPYEYSRIRYKIQADWHVSTGEIFAQNALGSAADWLFPPRASCSAQARAP